MDDRPDTGLIITRISGRNQECVMTKVLCSVRVFETQVWLRPQVTRRPTTSLKVSVGNSDQRTGVIDVTGGVR